MARQFGCAHWPMHLEQLPCLGQSLIDPLLIVNVELVCYDVDFLLFEAPEEELAAG